MAGDLVPTLSNGHSSPKPNPKRNYKVVVAATKDMGIGKDGQLPWKLPLDLKFFKDAILPTDAEKKNASIMSRKTCESILPKHRLLPGYLNIMLTRLGSFDTITAKNVMICRSMNFVD